MSLRTPTPTDYAETFASFIDRTLSMAEGLASAAQRGETQVVRQYLKSLASLRAEAERYWDEAAQRHEQLAVFEEYPAERVETIKVAGGVL